MTKQVDFYEAVRNEENVLQARNLQTGEVVDVRENDGLEAIRYSMLNTAEKKGDVVRVQNGKCKRIPPQEAKVEMEQSSKKDYSEIREERDPEIMFENLEILTRLVGRGINPSLLVTGMAGMGKTHIVNSTLRDMNMEESKHFIQIKGRATAVGLYCALYEYQDKVIVFDDCDSIFKDDDAVNILKGALDSYDKRIISYLSGSPLKDAYENPIPHSFEFKGKIIFISNRSQSQLDPALKSRSFVAEVSLNQKQMFQRIEKLMPDMETAIPMKSKELALQIMKELAAEFRGVEINLRSFIKASRLTSLGQPIDSTKSLIAEQIITPDR